MAIWWRLPQGSLNLITRTTPRVRTPTETATSLARAVLALFLSSLCARPKFASRRTNRVGISCAVHIGQEYTLPHNWKIFLSPASQKTFYHHPFHDFALAPSLNSNFISTLHEKMRINPWDVNAFDYFLHRLHKARARNQIFTQLTSLTLKTLRNFFTLRLVAEAFHVRQLPKRQPHALEAQNHEFEATSSDCHYHRQFIKWDWTSTAFVSSANKMKNRNKYRSFPFERVCVRSEIISREPGARFERNVSLSSCAQRTLLIHCGESEPENCTKMFYSTWN